MINYSIAILYVCVMLLSYNMLYYNGYS